jgi:protein TonB
MFEDALMESSGRITTHRGWFSGVAAVCNGSIVCFLMLWPLLHPASLPKQTFGMLLAAPAPPAPPLPVIPRVVNAVTRPAALMNLFSPPRIIPDHIATADPEPPPAMNEGIAPLAKYGEGPFTGISDSIGRATPSQVRVTPSRKPVISSGVMEGRKLSAAEPRYPTIAIAARVQGTVVLAATISRTGTIENLRAVSGPPMLRPAAEEAVQTWHYRPYLLNGEPVEVETTITVASAWADRKTRHALASANARADSSSVLTDSFDTDSE